MIHLSYHPAFDAFNTIFRIFRIKARTDVKRVEIDKLRILDYYLMFPWRAAKIRLAQKDIDIRRSAKRLESKRDYATLPAGETLLERMRASQMAALQTLVEEDFVDQQELRNGVVAFDERPPPVEIERLILIRNADDEETMNIIHRIYSYPLLGADGLKSRTALLDHRYDKI